MEKKLTSMQKDLLYVKKEIDWLKERVKEIDPLKERLKELETKIEEEEIESEEKGEKNALLPISLREALKELKSVIKNYLNQKCKENQLHEDFSYFFAARDFLVRNYKDLYDQWLQECLSQYNISSSQFTIRLKYLNRQLNKWDHNIHHLSYGEFMAKGPHAIDYILKEYFSILKDFIGQQAQANTIH